MASDSKTQSQHSILPNRASIKGSLLDRALIESGDGGLEDWRRRGGAVDPILGSKKSIDRGHDRRESASVSVILGGSCYVWWPEEVCVCV